MSCPAYIALIYPRKISPCYQPPHSLPSICASHFTYLDIYLLTVRRRSIIIKLTLMLRLECNYVLASGIQLGGKAINLDGKKLPPAVLTNCSDPSGGRTGTAGMVLYRVNYSGDYRDQLRPPTLHARLSLV